MYVSSVAHVLGDLRKISELAQDDGVDLAPLIEEIVHFRESDRDIWELAAAAAEETLACLDARPDLILYVSENDPDSTGSLARLSQHLRLESVDHLALAGRDCGNLALALEVAGALIAAGRHRRVLLVLADRSPRGRRVMASGLSVFSDSAAACLVTGEPDASASLTRRVLDVATSTAVLAGHTGPSEQGILSTVRLASASIAALLERVGLEREDFSHAVLPNYRPAAQKFLMAALKVPTDRLLLGPVTEMGHCFSADVLITLERHQSAGTLAPGDRVLASTSGPHSWSTLAVECL